MKFRKALSMPGLLAEMRRCFEAVEDEVAGRGLTLADGLVSGLAIFAHRFAEMAERGGRGASGDYNSASGDYTLSLTSQNPHV